jgi:hypothetical protein
VNNVKWKKIGVAISGALLLGSTLVGAAAGADPDDISRDLFINPDNGEPQSLIVVGSNAAASDVVSASWISAQIGSMAYYEEVTPNENVYSVLYEEEWEVDNFLDDDDDDDKFDDFRFALWEAPFVPAEDMIPDSWVVLPYVCDSTTFAETFPPDVPENQDMMVPKDATMPWWDYDVYVDHLTDFGCAADVMVDTGCSFESISVDFSIRDVECTEDMCIGCTAGCDQMGLFWYENAGEGSIGYGWEHGDGDGDVDADEIFTFQELLDKDEELAADTMEPIAWELVQGIPQLQECQTYPNVYPRYYWGSPSGAEDMCDPIGGMQYRSTVYGLNGLKTVTWDAIIGPDSEAYGVCEPTSPEPVELYCETCDVYFLGQHYDAISFGTNEDGIDYMFYGTPKWYVEEKLKVGESKEFGDFTLTINDLGIYENKAHVTVTDGEGVDHDYMVVIDTYTSQVPSDGEGDCDNEENDTLAFTEETCGTEEVVFAVNFVKTMIGASGNYVVEFHAYNLLDYGCLKERIYPGPCETVTDELHMPYVTSDCGGEQLDWYLDIIPSNGVQTLDLDNDPSLWDEANPNFDACDDLSIYANMWLGGLYQAGDVFKLWDTDGDGAVDTPLIQMSTAADPAGTNDDYAFDLNFDGGTINGTSYTATEVFQMWDAFVGQMSYYYEMVPVDVSLGGTLSSYNSMAFANDTDGDGTLDTDDSTGTEYLEATIAPDEMAVPLCSPMLELWLATPVELAGMCNDALTICLDDMNGNDYFTLEVTDAVHTDYQIDGEIRLYKTEELAPTISKVYVDINPAELVALDTEIEVNPELKSEYNLILVGGPVANSIVQQMVDLGETTFEEWDTSEGEYKLYEDAFAAGKHVLIVAGKDRDATAQAAHDLIEALTA